MYTQVIAADIRILSITSTGAHQSLKKLINDALAANSVPAKALPDLPVIQVILTPSADVVIADGIMADEYTITSGSHKTFPVANALERLTVKNSATVIVEIYFGR